jgi:hypothetical protein
MTSERSEDIYSTLTRIVILNHCHHLLKEQISSPGLQLDEPVVCESPLTTGCSKIFCSICCSIPESVPDIPSLIVPVCKRAYYDSGSTRGCTDKTLEVCSQHDGSASHTQTSLLLQRCGEAAHTGKRSDGCVGPRCWFANPFPRSNAEARGASDDRGGPSTSIISMVDVWSNESFFYLWNVALKGL